MSVCHFCYEPVEDDKIAGEYPGFPHTIRCTECHWPFHSCHTCDQKHGKTFRCLGCKEGIYTQEHHYPTDYNCVPS